MQEEKPASGIVRKTLLVSEVSISSFACAQLKELKGVRRS
jgi:hypothetical protein